jgi:hypothetical protein
MEFVTNMAKREGPDYILVSPHNKQHLILKGPRATLIHEQRITISQHWRK